MADYVHTLAANLNRLMDYHRDNHLGYGSNAALGKAAGVSSNTIGRLRRGDGAITLSKLSKIAKVFKLAAWELLHPGFEPGKHLEVVIDPAERALLTAFRQKPTQH